MAFQIHGLGTAAPELTITQAESLKCALAVSGGTPEQAKWLTSIYTNSGIQSRHSSVPRAAMDDVLEGRRDSASIWLPGDNAGPSTSERMEAFQQTAGPLAICASSRALAEAGLPPSQITHLVIVTCTGFAAPGIDRALVEGIRLSPTVERTQVGFMGCHGALNGLRVAAAFAKADPAAKVVLCAVELCSLHYYYGDAPQKLVANALFADGAAAVVGAASKATESPEWTVRAHGSCLIPESADAMGWRIGDHGFEMSLDRRIPSLIARNLRPWLSSWLEGYGLSVEQIASWAIHPGGPRILSAIEESLQLTPEQAADARAVFSEYGNMSSATVLFILDRLRRRQAPRPCIMLAFGPGLWAEAALLD